FECNFAGSESLLILHLHRNFQIRVMPSVGVVQLVLVVSHSVARLPYCTSRWGCVVEGFDVILDPLLFVNMSIIDWEFIFWWSHLHGI
ncbi:hypothetical protein H0H93_008485, partial [Arthromyces matolae]